MQNSYIVPFFVSAMPGYRQVLEDGFQTSFHTDKTTQHGNLSGHLLRMWGEGFISAHAVQKICHMAYLDGLKQDAVGKLASMGSWGKHPGNVTRDLKAFVSREVGNPYANFRTVSCQCWNPRTSQNEAAQLAYFDPKDVLDSLLQRPDDFDRILNPSGIQDFWAGVKDSDPRFQMLSREVNVSKEDLQNCIPLWLHGDGVEYVDGRSLMVYSMGSVLATGSTLDSTLLLAGIPKDICWHTTWDTVFEQWVASFTRLQGPRSVGQYSFTLWAIRGDQEFYANSLKLPHWRNPRPCWECNLDGEQCLNIQDPIPPNEMRQVEDECRARRSPHLIFTIPGVSHFSICQDAMHILFCKGVLSHCMGNTLKHWCWHSNHASFAGRRPKERLGIIYSAIQQFYKLYQTTAVLSLLKMSMFVNVDRPHKEQPFLRTKAAESKGLVPVFASLALEFNEGTETDELIIQLYDSMSQLLDLMDNSGFFPSDEEATQAMECMNLFLESYSDLRANAESDKLWHKTIKFHMSRHLAAGFQWMNPKRFWCFSNEDYVGRISRLAHSASFGTSLLVLSQKVAEKYRHLQHVRFCLE